MTLNYFTPDILASPLNLVTDPKRNVRAVRTCGSGRSLGQDHQVNEVRGCAGLPGPCDLTPTPPRRHRTRRRIRATPRCRCPLPHRHRPPTPGASKALTLRTVASNPPASNPCCTDIEPDNDHADTPATMPIGGLFFLFVDYPHFSTERVSGANGLSGVSALPSFAHPASRQWSLSRGRTTWLTRPMAMSSTPRNQPWIAIRCIR